MDLSDAVPPDDTGSDTYRRYRYQAQIAFPYVLACALGEGVSAVLLEHIEDIAVLEGSTWSLKQVKTRDAGRGPWKASDVRANGGGLDSLYRAYRSLRTLDSECVFQLLLEGATKNNDAIEAFCDGTAHENPDLVRKVHESLGRDDDPDCTEADV